MAEDAEQDPYIQHKQSLYSFPTEFVGTSTRSMKEIHSASQKIMAHSSRISSKYHPKQPTNSPTVTIFLLLNTMLGSGILNQPAVFRDSGIIGGIVGYIIASIACWYGLVVLTSAGVHVNVLEFSGLANKAFGKLGESIVDVSIVVLCFGGQLGYIIIVGATSADLLRSWGCPGNVCSDIAVTLASVALFVTPMCFFRHFGHMGILSLISIAATVGVGILVWACGPYEHVHENLGSNYQYFSIEGMLASTGSIIFAISCTTGNFPAYITTEKEFQDLPSWDVITGISVAAGAFICASMGIVGYISFEDNTEGNILDNFPQHGYDIFKILMVVHLILYIPVNFIIMRYSLVKICSGMKSEDLRATSHIMITLGLDVLATGIVITLMAIGYTSGAALSLILNLSGGIGGKVFYFFSVSLSNMFS
jgi:sodium-coupled neutral amino acid transporter 11